MNQRTTTVLIVIVLVLAAIWAITAFQMSARTTQYLADLEGGDTEAAVQALEGLSTRDRGIVSRLQPTLRSDHPLIRSRAVRLIGAVGTAKDARHLMPVLQSDPSVYVRRDAAVALGKLAGQQVPLSLAKALKNEQEAGIVRAAAARSLGMLGVDRGGKGGVPMLVKILKNPPPVPANDEENETMEDPTEQLRIAAAEALGMLPTEEAVEALGEAADHEKEPSLGVRTAAVYSLGEIAMKAGKELSAPAINNLIAAYDDPMGDVRIASIYAFTKIHLVPEATAEKVKSVVKRARNDRHFWVRAAAENASDHLARMGT